MEPGGDHLHAVSPGGGAGPSQQGHRDGQEKDFGVLLEWSDPAARVIIFFGGELNARENQKGELYTFLYLEEPRLLKSTASHPGQTLDSRFPTPWGGDRGTEDIFLCVPTVCFTLTVPHLHCNPGKLG